MNGEASILSVLPEEKFKIVIVGESGAGKSTILASSANKREIQSSKGQICIFLFQHINIESRQLISE